LIIYRPGGNIVVLVLWLLQQMLFLLLTMVCLWRQQDTCQMALWAARTTWWC